MISLRMALESRSEAPLSEFPDFPTNPLVVALESRPFSRRRVQSSIALEAINPALLIAGVAIVFAAIVKMIEWFIGGDSGSSSSSGGSGGSGGGALGKVESKLPNIESGLQRLGTGNEIRKSVKNERFNDVKNAKPEEKTPKILTVDDMYFVDLEIGTPWLTMISLVEKQPKYFDAAVGLLGLASSFMESWGKVGPDMELTDELRKKLSGFPAEFDEKFKELDAIHNVGESGQFPSRVRDMKEDIHIARSKEAKLSDSVYLGWVLGFQQQASRLAETFKDQLGPLREKLKALEEASTKHEDARKQFTAEQFDANQRKDGPDADLIRTQINEGRLRMNAVGNYTRAVLSVTHIAIDQLMRIDKITKSLDEDTKAFNTWFVKLEAEGSRSFREDVADLINEYKEGGMK